MKRTREPSLQALIDRSRSCRRAQLRDARGLLTLVAVFFVTGPAAVAMSLDASRGQAWAVLAGGVVAYAMLLAGVMVASGWPSALEVVVARNLVADGATPDDAADQTLAMSRVDRWRLADSAAVARMLRLPAADVEQRKQRALASDAAC